MDNRDSKDFKDFKPAAEPVMRPRRRAGGHGQYARSAGKRSAGPCRAKTQR